MKIVRKKQILMLSDGSTLSNKTYIKVSSRVKSLNKDHKTFIFNKKNTNLERRSKEADHFKSKFFKF